MLRLLLLVICFGLATPTHAQYDINFVELGAVCEAGVVSVHGRVRNYIGFEDNWSGWVIARTSVGVCDDWLTLSDLQAFPDSGLVADVEIEDFVSGDTDRAFKYGIRIVVEGGAVIDPPGSHFFWPFVHYEYVACETAPVVRGTLHDFDWAILIDRCEGACWAPADLIDWSDLPAQYHGYIGTDQVFELSGEVFCGGVEGCGLDVTNVALVPGCNDPVAVQTTSWSVLRSRFE